MKKLSLLLLMALGISFGINAQGSNSGKCDGTHKGKTTGFKMQTPEQRADRMVTKLDESLELTEFQKTEIKKIKTESFSAVERIKAPYKSTLDQMHEEMKTLRENRPEPGDEGIDKKDKSAFKAVKDKYKSQLEPMHEAMKVQHKTDKEKISALLTDEQKAKFESMKKDRSKGEHKGHPHR